MISFTLWKDFYKSITVLYALRVFNGYESTAYLSAFLVFDQPS